MDVADHFQTIGNHFSEVGSEVASFLSSLADFQETSISPEDVKVLSSCVEELCELEKQNLVKATIVSTISQQIKAGDITTAEEIEENFQARMGELQSGWSEQVVHDHPSYRRAQDAMSALCPSAMEGGDEIAFSQTQISTRCPLTTRTFQHPIQSKHCGHTFEQSAIEKVLARQGYFCCCVQGCREGRRRLVKSDFRVDKRMKRLLETMS